MPLILRVKNTQKWGKKKLRWESSSRQEVLKAVYQYSALLSKLRALKKL